MTNLGKKWVIVNLKLPVPAQNLFLQKNASALLLDFKLHVHLVTIPNRGLFQLQHAAWRQNRSRRNDVFQ